MSLASRCSEICCPSLKTKQHMEFTKVIMAVGLDNNLSYANNNKEEETSALQDRWMNPYITLH